VEGSDDNFYGTTQYGGPNNTGTVFKISTNGVVTTLHFFATGDYNQWPRPGLVQGSDGYFYGTDGIGTVFKISTNGVFTTLYSFTSGNDGGLPNAALVQGSEGNFYGTTRVGGNTHLNEGSGFGTVFKISTNGTLTTLYSFTGGDDGAYLQAALVQGRDGFFYGTTGRGGSVGMNRGYGTVFKISPNGVLTTLYSFGSVQDTNGVPLDGAYPQAALVQGSDGYFYGTTYYGGQGGGGTVFRLTIVPDPQLTIIPSGANMILTWPTNSGAFSYAGYALESTTNLGSPTSWNPVSPSPVVIGGQNVVVSPISGTQQFFRLSQ